MWIDCLEIFVNGFIAKEKGEPLVVPINNEINNRFKEYIINKEEK